MTTRLLSAFHPSGSSFAILSHDQRLKLFNTLTHQLTHDLSEAATHLTHGITAVAFPPLSVPAQVAPLVAVGTKNGEILLWNTKKGSIERSIGASSGHKHPGAITSLAFAPSGAFIYSCGAEKCVKQWSVSNGSMVARFDSSDDSSTLLQLALSPNGELLVAGGMGSLFLWAVSNPATPLRDYQGATDRISCVAFSPDSKYVVSGMTTDRYLTMWSASTDSEPTENGTSKKKSKKNKQAAALNTPVHTFTLQTAPINVQFNEYASKNTYQIAALSDSSILSLLNYTASSSSSSSSSSSASFSTPVSVVTIPAATSQSESSKRRDDAHKHSKNKQKQTAASSTLLGGEEGDAIGAGAIQAVHFSSASALMVARGDAVRPLFQSVTFQQEDGSFQSTIVLPKYSQQHLLNPATAQLDAASKKRKAAGAASSSANEAVTIGAQHMTDMVHAPKSGLDGEQPQKRAKLATSKSKADALSRSLADRLAESESLAAAAASTGAAAFNLAAGELPKAGSLQTILQQALHSNDAALVEYCLTQGSQAVAGNNPQLIAITVRRLAPVYVLPLLQHLMSKFSSRPNRSAALLPWLRALFNSHTSYLIRQPNLTAQLSPLQHLLDSRSALFKKMIKLQARLDLLLSQMAQVKNGGAQAGAQDEEEAAQSGPINTFNDGEQDDDEEEDDFAQGDSDLDDEDEDLDEEEDDEDMEESGEEEQQDEEYEDEEEEDDEDEE